MSEYIKNSTKIKAEQFDGSMDSFNRIKALAPDSIDIAIAPETDLEKFENYLIDCTNQMCEIHWEDYNGLEYDLVPIGWWVCKSDKFVYPFVYSPKFFMKNYQEVPRKDLFQNEQKN